MDVVISKIKQQQDFWHAKGSELAKDIDTISTTTGRAAQLPNLAAK